MNIYYYVYQISSLIGQLFVKERVESKFNEFFDDEKCEQSTLTKKLEISTEFCQKA